MVESTVKKGITMPGNESVRFGRTDIGQAVYDFGMAKLTDKWLARKYKMPIGKVRELKKKVRKALK